MIPVRIEPDPQLVEKWRMELGADDKPIIVLPTRWLSRGSAKNTAPDDHQALADHCAARGWVPVTVGRCACPGPGEGLPGLDLINKTSLADLVAIYSLAACVAGASTGTMHLAAACGTPHVVWGGAREDVRNRYTRTWNLLGTPCTYLSLGWKVNAADVVAAVEAAVAAGRKEEGEK